MTAVWLFKLFDQVWAKENYGDIIDGHHPFRHCQQICPKLSNLLSRSHLSFYIVSGIWSNEGSFWRHQYKNIIFRSFSMCVHVPSVWDRHVCLDDGALRWWAFSLNFTISFLECFSPSGQIKTVLGACPHYNFGFWGLMTALIAYLVPDWRDMQVAAKLIPQIKQLLVCLCLDVLIIRIVPQLIFSVPLVLLYSAYWVFPESSRWLLANGRVEEAEDIVREIARWNKSQRRFDECFRRTNGRVLPAQWRLLPPSKSSCSEGFNFENIKSNQIWRFELWLILKNIKSKKVKISRGTKFAEGGSATSFFRLFTMPNMRKKTFICYYLWFRWCNPQSPTQSNKELLVQHFLHKFKMNPPALTWWSYLFQSQSDNFQSESV